MLSFHNTSLDRRLLTRVKVWPASVAAEPDSGPFYDDAIAWVMPYILVMSSFLAWQVSVDGPHTTATISMYGMMQVPIKVQNQTSRCCVRFAQKMHDVLARKCGAYHRSTRASPHRSCVYLLIVTAEIQSRMWQTVYPSTTAPYAWEDPSYMLPSDRVPEDVQFVQRPQLLTLKIFTYER